VSGFVLQEGTQGFAGHNLNNKPRKKLDQLKLHSSTPPHFTFSFFFFFFFSFVCAGRDGTANGGSETGGRETRACAQSV
jgi:hypothetical protein